MRAWNVTLLLLIWLGVGNYSHAADVILQWDANTEPDLAGYKVYYKANSAELPFDGAGAVEGVAPIDVASQTTATITGLDPGADYYFAVTAYNTSGMESSYSEIIALPGVKDTTPPSVSLDSPLAAATVSGAVQVTATATDDIGVSRVELYQQDHLISAGNVAPYASIWDTSALPDGSYTITAKAYDAAGNVGATTVTVTVVNDTIAPQILSFLVPASATTLTVPVTLTASDNAGVTGYVVSESSAVPAVNAAGWSTTAPTTFTFSAYGSHTLYAWAKDGAGNVSAVVQASITLAEPDLAAPSVTSFSMPSAATSTTVAISAFSASDDRAVTGYLITETATPPVPSVTGWSSSAPTRFTFAATGIRTAYAWAKDAAGNVSQSKSCTVVIDNLAPAVTGPSVSTTGNSVTISASARDNVAVVRMQLYLDGLLLAQNTSSSISYQIKLGKGKHTVTAKAYDAAGNVGVKSITVTK